MSATSQSRSVRRATIAGDMRTALYTSKIVPSCIERDHVAIFITKTAFLVTSAWRFWPWGLLGTLMPTKIEDNDQRHGEDGPDGKTTGSLSMTPTAAAMRPCPAEPVQGDRDQAQDDEVPKGGVVVHRGTVGPGPAGLNPRHNSSCSSGHWYSLT